MKIIKKNMPNNNYIKGRKREYKEMQRLRENGCDIVFRSAGSHSEIDVIGINTKTLEIFTIQCKPESLSTNKRDEIALRNRLLNNIYVVTFEVI